MNVYSTAYHTVKFTINTVDEDGFVKSIDGENFVQIDRADIDGVWWLWLPHGRILQDF